MQYPLVLRELTRQSRRPGFYAARTIAPALLVPVLCVAMPLAPNLDDIGAICQAFARFFQFAVLCLLAPIATADLIAREREENTLPILLLTAANTRDIVFSKYISGVMICLLLIVSTTPLTAIAALFGGVTVSIGVAETLVHAAVAAMVCALGILASTIADRTRTAVWTAYVLAVVAIAAFSFVLGGPYTNSLNSGDLSLLEQNGPAQLLGAALPTVVAAGIVTAVALVLGCLAMTRTRTAPLPRKRVRSRRLPHMKQIGYRQALARLASCAVVARGPTSLLLGAIALVLATAVAYRIGPIAWPCIIVFVAYRSALDTRSLVRSQALDDLRLVPAEEHELGRAVIQRNVRGAMFLLPAFLLAGTKLVLVSTHPITQIVAFIVVITMGMALIRYAAAQACDCDVAESPFTVVLLVLLYIGLLFFLAALLALIASATVVVVLGAFHTIDFGIGSYAFVFAWWLALLQLLNWGARFMRLPYIDVGPAADSWRTPAR